MNNKKKLILKISGILLLVLIICTFVSRTIYTMLLPVVKYEIVQNGTINTSADAKANFSYTNIKHIIAKDNSIINEVKVQNGQNIKAKDAIFTTYVSNDNITTKKLQLALLQQQNQLIPNPIPDKSISEIEKQIGIAKKELELYNDGVPYDNYFKEEQIKRNIQDIEKRIEYGGLTTDEEKQLKNDLKIALEHKNQYELQQATKNKVEDEKLQLAIDKLNNQLTQADISDEKKNEINLLIEISRQELADHKAKIANGGKFTSEYEGTITKLLIKDGDNITNGQHIADITTKDSKKCVTWTMSFEASNEYTVGSKVNVLFAVEDGKDFDGTDKKKEVVVTTEVTDRQYDEKNNSYIFTANIKDYDNIPLETPVNIKLIKSSVPYNTILPTSCLNKESDGKYYVLVIEERQGFFKKESYLKKVQVEIIEKNNLAAAVKSTSVYERMKIVKYTSKPINDGDIVSVVD